MSIYLQIFITAVTTFLVTAYLYNFMHKRLDSKDEIQRDILNLIEAHLLYDEKIETLRSLKKDQIRNLVANKDYHNASKKDIYSLSNLTVKFYEKIGEEVPENAKNWVSTWSSRVNE